MTFAISSDKRGATLVEFAIVAPVMLTLLLGGLELGHTMYVRAILRGQVEKAARDLSLESSSGPLGTDPVLARIRRNVQAVASSAQVTFVTTAYHDYKSARDRAEEYDDRNHDGRCDANEPYVDANNNNQWDIDLGVAGRGGAKDVVLFTATATYPRLALGRFFGSSDIVRLQASTLLRNQPSDDQSAAPLRSCPA